MRRREILGFDEIPSLVKQREIRRVRGFEEFLEMKKQLEKK